MALISERCRSHAKQSADRARLLWTPTPAAMGFNATSNEVVHKLTEITISERYNVFTYTPSPVETVCVKIKT